MKSTQIHPSFGAKHREYIRDAITSTVSVAEGAVRAGKTIDNITAFAYLIEHGTPDRIHLATGSTVANAKLNIGDANGYGLEHIFRGRCKWTKYRGNEALAIMVKRRQYVVIFAGGGKADSFKKIRGNSYGIWIATEINLHHEDMIKEAFNRQLAAANRRIFWDLNPSAPGAWIYERYIDRFPEQFGGKYNYEHFTIRDNETISPERMEEIIRQYEPGSIWYARDIEGRRCMAEGSVYDMFSEARNVVDVLPELAGDCYVSCDYGTQNPTVFLLWRRERGCERWVCVREYYYSGRDKRRQKTDSEFADDLKSWLGEDKPRAIVVDPSAASFIAELRQRGWAVQKADNDVLDGIRDTAQRIQAGELLFSHDCTHTLEEFQAYVWDEKASLQGLDKPVKANDHCLTGDTLVDTTEGQRRIDDLVGKSGQVFCTDGKTVKIRNFHDVRVTRKCAEVFEIRLADGGKIRATGDHPVLTRRGWVQVKDLKPTDEIAKIGE